MRRTHERRPANKGMIKWYGLPTKTPIVGDVVVYETWGGDLLHAKDAERRLRDGKSVYYTTWED